VSFLPGQLQAPGGIVDTLGHYYQRHGDWAGVDNLMEGARATFRLWAGGMDLRVLDQNGVPVYQLVQRPGNPGAGMGGAGMAASGPPDNRPLGMGLMGRRRTPIELPITVNGQTVGFLEARLMMVDGAAGATGDIFQQLSSYILFVAVAAGILGAIFSVAASRMLTAPLNQLADAARAIGAGNLAQRVESKGSDEVAAVAVAFNEMATQLQEAETLRRNLMADVAHELRTPLSVIQGNLRAIIDDVYPLNKEEVTRLYTQTRLLSRLVSDLHELAQAEAGQLSLNITLTDLRPLLQETVEIFAPMAEDAEIVLQSDFAVMLPAVPVDSVRLRQVLHNLLANALRHTHAGGTVTVTSSVGANAVKIAIRDTGDGLAADHLAHIFDRFYRTDRARTRDTGGAGLGLAIVRAIVQAHGGTVTAASAGIGQGSTFTVTLPVAG